MKESIKVSIKVCIKVCMKDKWKYKNLYEWYISIVQDCFNLLLSTSTEPVQNKSLKHEKVPNKYSQQSKKIRW